MACRKGDLRVAHSAALAPALVLLLLASQCGSPCQFTDLTLT